MEFEESITAMYTTLKAVAKRVLKKTSGFGGISTHNSAVLVQWSTN